MHSGHCSACDASAHSKHGGDAWASAPAAALMTHSAHPDILVHKHNQQMAAMGRFNDMNPVDKCIKDPCTGVVKCPVPYVTKEKTEPPIEYRVCKIEKPCEAKTLPLQPCQQKVFCKPPRRTHCYELPGPRADGYPQDPKPYRLLLRDEFEGYDVGCTDCNNWIPFQHKDFKADDGEAKVTKGGLVISSKKFDLTYPCADEITKRGYLDRFKYFVLRHSEYEVPDCGQLYVEAVLSARVYGVDRASADHCSAKFGNCVGDAYSDPRLARSEVTMYEPETGLRLGIALTNTAIYAIYEVLPFDTDDGCGEHCASFLAAYWVAGRDPKEPLCDFVKVGIAVDKRKGGLWYVNDVLVHQQPRLGALPNPQDTLVLIPGRANEIRPTCMRVGFGHFTLMDGHLPPSLGGDSGLGCCARKKKPCKEYKGKANCGRDDSSSSSSSSCYSSSSSSSSSSDSDSDSDCWSDSNKKCTCRGGSDSSDSDCNWNGKHRKHCALYKKKKNCYKKKKCYKINDKCDRDTCNIGSKALIRLSKLDYRAPLRPALCSDFVYNNYNPVSRRNFGQGVTTQIKDFSVQYRL